MTGHLEVNQPMQGQRRILSLKAMDMIMCCLLRAGTDEHGAMME
jgi:hypothetical protein